jgi:glycerol-3-phosphate acyltransferase PlsY
MDYLIIITISYLLGSIPFGLLLTKFFLNKDIRKIGSGNIGATNVLRSGNKLIGYTTLFFDILKAVLPVLYVKFNHSDFIYISSLSVFLGHVFPIWLKFKGGKGVASYIGILFSISLIYGLVFGVAWILIFLFSKYSSLASLVGSFSIPVYVFIFNENQTIFFIIMFVLIFYTHRENIKRRK